MNGICEEIPEIIANKIILMAMEMKNLKINKLIKYTPTPKNKKKMNLNVIQIINYHRRRGWLDCDEKDENLYISCFHYHTLHEMPYLETPEIVE